MPYRVRIGITALGKAEWAKVESALAGSAWYTARLLAGEMPERPARSWQLVSRLLPPCRRR